MSDRFVIEYTITPDAMLDASRLYRATYLRIVLAIAAVLALVGVALTIAGAFGIGVWLAIFGVLTLLLARLPFVDRWILRMSARGLIGERMTYNVDEDGIHYDGPTSTGLMPWSSFTSVRADDKSIAFARDRVVPAYVPSSAFASPAERTAFLAFARSHIGHVPGSGI
jgi:hypothetical protein